MVKEASLPGQAQGTVPTFGQPQNGQHAGQAQGAVPTEKGDAVVENEEKPKLPSMDGLKLVEKCPKCKEIVYIRDWEKNLKVCSRCNYHFRLSAYERIALLVDQGSFVELDKDLVSADPLHFTTNPPTYTDQQPYTKKLAEAQGKTGLNDAVVIGHATIETRSLAMAVMDFNFMGGSMGSVVGEKITRTIDASDGTIRYSKQDVVFEGDRKQLSRDDLIEID